MLWLQPIPWARWAAAAAIAAVALWVEIAPDPTVPHPFAIADISRGDQVGSANTELRDVPAGILPPPGPGGFATRDIPSGSPLGPGDLGAEETIVPAGWWLVSWELPSGAASGDRVRVVLLDSGRTVDGVVASAQSDDPFAVGMGSVAVPPDSAPEVARAAADGRLMVLVGTG